MGEQTFALLAKYKIPLTGASSDEKAPENDGTKYRSTSLIKREKELLNKNYKKRNFLPMNRVDNGSLEGCCHCGKRGQFKEEGMATHPR